MPLPRSATRSRQQGPTATRRAVCRIAPHVAELDVDLSPEGHRLAGIEHQVLDDLGDLVGIGVDRPGGSVGVDGADGIRSAGGEVGGLADDRLEVDDALHRQSAASESEELLRQPAGALSRGLRVVQYLAEIARQAAVAGREGDVAEDSGEQVVEVVSDASGQHRQRLEPLRLRERFGRADAVADVLADRHRAGRTAILVDQRGVEPLAGDSEVVLGAVRGAMEAPSLAADEIAPHPLDLGSSTRPERPARSPCDRVPPPVCSRTPSRLPGSSPRCSRGCPTR